MLELGCACDGGKDSLSMAAAAGGETVMAPGNLVVSAYVGCPDVTKVRQHFTAGQGRVSEASHSDRRQVTNTVKYRVPTPLRY